MVLFQLKASAFTLESSERRLGPWGIHHFLQPFTNYVNVYLQNDHPKEVPWYLLAFSWCLQTQRTSPACDLIACCNTVAADIIAASLWPWASQRKRWNKRHCHLHIVCHRLFSWHFWFHIIFWEAMQDSKLSSCWSCIGLLFSTSPTSRKYKRLTTLVHKEE